MTLPQITLGDGMLGTALLASVETTQQLNTHWWCTISCRQTEETRLPAEDLLGKPVQILPTDEQGTTHTHFSGFVCNVELDYEVWGSYGARNIAVSKSFCWTMPPTSTTIPLELWLPSRQRSADEMVSPSRRMHPHASR